MRSLIAFLFFPCVFLFGFTELTPDTTVVSKVKSKDVEQVLELENGLLFRCDAEMFANVRIGTPITCEFVNRQEEDLFIDQCTLHATYKDWFFQTHELVSIQGNAYPLSTSCFMDENSLAIEFLSADNKTMTLKNGETYINTQFNGDKENPIPEWSLGDTLMEQASKESWSTFYNTNTDQEMHFYSPTVSLNSRIKETYIIKVTKPGFSPSYTLWVELENGCIVPVINGEMHRERYCIDDAIIYHFLAETDKNRTDIYHHLYNFENRFDYSFDFQSTHTSTGKSSTSNTIFHTIE